MIDKTTLDKEVRKIADKLLADILSQVEIELQDNLRQFVEEAKDVAESILNEYVFEIVNKYTEDGPYKITDATTLGAFVDFSTGYQKQMLAWIKEHPLEVKEETFEMPKAPQGSESKSMKPLAVAVGGTVVAIGLYVFSNVWIALAAELLTLTIAKLYSNKLQRDHRIEMEVKQKQHEIAIKTKKDQLVEGLIMDLGKWLDKGEEVSNKLLKSFNLKD